MLKDRKDLDVLLNMIIQKYNTDRDKTDKIIDIMMEHGISPGEASKLTEGQILLQEVQNISILYIYTDALYRATGNNQIKPENWFVEDEIREGKEFKVEEEEKIDEIILHNVTLNGTRHFVCPKVSGLELAKWMKQRLLTYNLQTQRPSIKTVVFDEYIKTPDIRTYKVSQITKMILQGEYTTDTLTLNIRKTNSERIDYDKDTQILRIPIIKENYIDIVDGIHRTIGNSKALAINPDLDISWSLNILNYDIREARRFISQTGKATPISRKDRTLYDTDNVNMLIAQDIATFGESKTNVMYNKMGEDIKDVQYRDKYTTFDTIFKAIDYNFDYDEDKTYDIQKVKENVVRGMNEILGYLDNKYGDLQKNKNKYVFLESNMFIGYIALLSTVWDSQTKTFTKDWDIAIQTVVDSIDFSRKNSLWETLSLFNNEKLNKTTISTISDYFKEKGDELNVREQTEIIQ